LEHDLIRTIKKAETRDRQQEKKKVIWCDCILLCLVTNSVFQRPKTNSSNEERRTMWL